MALHAQVYAAGYLAGLIDGEGHVSLGRRRVIITNTERDIIDAAVDAARLLELPTVVRERWYYRAGNPRKRPLWDVEIPGMAACARLLEIVELGSGRKRELLKQAATPVPEGRCSGCGCLWSERTYGCKQCAGRHGRRRRMGVAAVPGRDPFIDMPEKACQQCGIAFGRRRYRSGQWEPPQVFARRLFCSRLCANRNRRVV